MAVAVHLNRKLVLETPERIQDGAGGYVENWVQLGTLWAEIRAGSGSETQSDLLTVSRVSAKIIVRGAPVGSKRRPKPEQRFVEGGRVFRILAVTEADTFGHYLTCTVSEEVTS
ncbi:head-tail adaptor protein [Celeribacter litoreus]|uniref:head-tail adaptor protein n=1 Tax=Celeribacter litoreus TaxID=2876714 RepID=UPI001CCB9A68|nr:head-tail adaptor protein [Celeribacter litoreus]MCA0044700.1 head-tail adaptor protein [Celeribacter litoreus]